MSVTKKLLGHVKGDQGDIGPAGKFTNVVATADGTHLPEPVCEASVSGEADDQTLTLNFRGLQGGGCAGPTWLTVDENGDLVAYYDDALGEPTVFSYDDDSGILYAIFDVEGE